jgi:hypothetical protein
MSKYLTVEEEQAFWTELFAVTFRYAQKRGAATQVSLHPVEGLKKGFVDATDHAVLPQTAQSVPPCFSLKDG